MPWRRAELCGKVCPSLLMSLSAFKRHELLQYVWFKFTLVQYNDKPHTEFQLNTYPTMAGVLAHIKSMPYHGGGTQTGLCLDFLTRGHLNAGSGGRAVKGAVQAVVMLTDGCSQDDAAVQAQVLRLAGMELFAVGVL